jgi:hypothetical protein
MQKTVVTSFTDEGYEVYGKNFIETFKKNWPEDVRLVVYYEGNNIRDDWHFIEEVEGYQDWMDNISKFPMMLGNIGDGTYNIQLDAAMVRKPLIQRHACKQYRGKVIWVDADVITHSKVTHEFLDKVLPDDKFCCFLGREGWTSIPYTESGFLGFNTSHPLYESFFGAYISVFTSGVIFTLPGWHDCYGFDAARRFFKQNQNDFVNLSAHLKPESTNHPFVNSVLGEVMDHKKGKRKLSRTDSSELVVDRKELYWKPIILKSA